MTLLAKITIIYLVNIYGLFGIINSSYSANNIAFGKSYIVSPKPSYRLTAPLTDVTSLTDGKYTTGQFWSNKSTVGWQKARPVEIIIDLENVFTVTSISFNTARSESAGVAFPAHVHAFIGSDREHFLYVGDIAKNRDNVPGSYKVTKFILSGLETKGRYVLLEVHPKGPFLFCDEIEVLEGKHDNGVAGTLNIDEARNYSERLRRADLDIKMIKNLIEDLKPNMTNLAQLANRLAGTEILLQNQSIALENAVVAENELFALRGEMLRLQNPGKEFLVSVLNPWVKVSPVYSITHVSDEKLFLVMPVAGYDYTALLITNLAASIRQYSITLKDKTLEMAEIFLYEVPFLKAASMEYVADPLVPLRSPLMLRPGESRMIYAASVGKNVGTCFNTLNIVSQGQYASISVKIQVVNLELARKFSLNSVCWNYLDFKPTRESKAAAMKDLFEHHSKVVVIYPAQLSLFEADGIQDSIVTKQAFGLQKGAEKILLFINFRDDRLRTANGRYEFLSVKWKEWFRTWYDKIVKVATTNGFTQEQLYLYAYDEMGGEEIGQFIAFATWVRNDIPGIKLYATLGKEDSERALPYLDIAQVVNNDGVLRKFNNSAAELWLYDAKGPAKSLSPYSYYRLMAWKAFLKGYKGIGFWAYGDTGWGDAKSSAWDDFDGNYPDFAVIYEGDGSTIISSRRWEAWRMGIEDYELLTMYAKIKSEGVAKALAEVVCDYPEDTSRADEVRRKILLELSGVGK